MRAAFISVSFLVLVRSSSILDTGGRQRSVPGDKCGYCSLCNFNVLLNGPGARSNGADYASVEHDGYAAAEDDYFAGITFLNAKQRLPRLRQARLARSVCPLASSSRKSACTTFRPGASPFPTRTPPAALSK